MLVSLLKGIKWNLIKLEESEKLYLSKTTVGGGVLLPI